MQCLTKTHAPTRAQGLSDRDLEDLAPDDAVEPEEESHEKAYLKINCKGERFKLRREELLIFFTMQAVLAGHDASPDGIRMVTESGPFHLYTTEAIARDMISLDDIVMALGVT